MGDFGQSILTKGNSNQTGTRTNKEAFGTDSYLAPEVINEEGDYTRSTYIDIWQVSTFFLNYIYKINILIISFF